MPLTSGALNPGSPLRQLKFITSQGKSLLTAFLSSWLMCACTINIHQKNAGNASTPVSLFEASQIMLPADGQRVPGEAILLIFLNEGQSGASAPSNQALTVSVRSAVQAYVNCYYQNSFYRTTRVYPQKHPENTQMAAGHVLEISIPAFYDQIKSSGDSSEAFFCFATSENLEERLPQWIKKSGVEGFSTRSFDEMYVIYKALTDRNLVARMISLDAHAEVNDAQSVRDQ